MKISFEVDLLMPPISNAISILTDRAKICVNDIKYDEANGIVEIPIQRYALTGFKKSSFGETKPIYSQDTIRSLLTIRQVEEIKIKTDDRLVTDCNSCFTLLFGLKMEDNSLYLGSAEEAQGNLLCQIFIKVRRMSIEISDNVEM